MRLLAGDPQSFAIEGSSDGDAVFGRFRFWIDGAEVGDWSKTVYLPGCTTNLWEVAKRRRKRYDRYLETLPANEVFLEVFDPFQQAFWSVERPQYASSFDDDHSVVERFWIGHVGMSSLDKYAVLFLKNEAGRERLLWSHFDMGVAHERWLPAGVVEQVAIKFCSSYRADFRPIATNLFAVEPKSVFFGDKATFAMEAVVRQYLSGYYYGGFRLWIGGRQVGDWEEETSLLGCYENLRRLLMPAWRCDPRLDSLPADGVLDAVVASSLESFRKGRSSPHHSLFGSEQGVLYRFDISDVGLSSLEHNLVLLTQMSDGRERLIDYDFRSDCVGEIVIESGTVRRTTVEFLKSFHSALEAFLQTNA